MNLVVRVALQVDVPALRPLHIGAFPFHVIRVHDLFIIGNTILTYDMIKITENDEANLFFASFDGLELVGVELRWVELVARIQHGRIFCKIRLS